MQLSRNKRMHAMYGNRKVTKIKSHQKMGQINKGHSNFSTHKELIIDLVNKNDFDILIVGKANFSEIEKDLHIDYPEYLFEAKFMKGYELARLVVLVKKGILFERINKYDKPNSSKLVLKIKIGNKKIFKFNV